MPYSAYPTNASAKIQILTVGGRLFNLVKRLTVFQRSRGNFPTLYPFPFPSLFFPRIRTSVSNASKSRSFGLVIVLQLLHGQNDPFIPSMHRFFTGKREFFASRLVAGDTKYGQATLFCPPKRGKSPKRP